MNLKRVYRLMLPFLALVSCGNGTSELSLPISTERAVAYGRVIIRENEFEMAYPHTGVGFKVRGVSNLYVSMYSETIDETNPTYVGVIVDEDTSKIAIEEGRKNYKIAQFPSTDSKEHVVKIIKLTEAQVGNLVIDGMHVTAMTDDFNVSPVDLAPMCIEFIGNSITCGYGNEDSTNHVGFLSEHQNAMKTYADIVARHYRAECCLTAYSGRGLLRNFSGDSFGTIPEIYERCLPDDASSSYSFNDAYTPNLVVINVGTNDFSAEMNTRTPVDSASFVKAMVAFVEELNRNYPKAKMIDFVGPMLNDEYPAGKYHLTKAIRYHTAAVEMMRKKGIPILFTTVTPQEPPFGDDFHPSWHTHRKMADELVAFIDSAVPWW